MTYYYQEYEKSLIEMGVSPEEARERANEKRRISRNETRRVNDQLRRDHGLVRGRDSLGRVIWE